MPPTDVRRGARHLALAVVLLLTAAPAQAQSPLPECVWCGAEEAPADLSWRTTIAGPQEPGERLVLRGRVCEADGRTAAGGVVLYLYHTNAEGVYATLGDETGNGRRHGHLRGWIQTDGRGLYEVRTIRPGHYPDRGEAAHVHLTVKEPGGRPEYSLPSFYFAGDPVLEAGADGANVVELRRGEDGTWYGTRDIVLPEVVKRRQGSDGVWYAPGWPSGKPSGCALPASSP